MAVVPLATTGKNTWVEMVDPREPAPGAQGQRRGPAQDGAEDLARAPGAAVVRGAGDGRIARPVQGGGECPAPGRRNGVTRPDRVGGSGAGVRSARGPPAATVVVVTPGAPAATVVVVTPAATVVVGPPAATVVVVTPGAPAATVVVVTPERRSDRRVVVTPGAPAATVVVVAPRRSDRRRVVVLGGVAVDVFPTFVASRAPCGARATDTPVLGLALWPARRAAIDRRPPWRRGTRWAWIWSDDGPAGRRPTR